MRRSIVLLLLMILCLPVFADRVGQFDFSAYYGTTKVGSEYLKLEIIETESSEYINYNGTVDAIKQDVGSEFEIFKWKLYSNTNKSVKVVFAFSPLQAEVDGLYYIPKHQIYMRVGTAEFYASAKDNYTLQIYRNYGVQDLNFSKLTVAADRPYLNYTWKGQEYQYNGQETKTFTFQYQYKLNGTWTAIDSTVTDLYLTDWVQNGTCGLKINEYTTISGHSNVDYASNVTIDISVD